MTERNIRSVASFMRSLPDWTEFNDCFAPSRIRISDIDGIVERNGQFLVLDLKHPNATLNQGQTILYRQLAKKGFTVVVVFGTTTHDIPSERCESGAEAMIADLGSIVVARLCVIHADGSMDDEEATNVDLWNFIRDWYVKANRTQVFRRNA
jgi:hypothetical protein